MSQDRPLETFVTLILEDSEATLMEEYKPDRYHVLRPLPFGGS
jgi:hypothetical protein